jgi:maltose alpha-D-glucosyltransferase / alpha-amylase
MNNFIPAKFRAHKKERKATAINRILLRIAHSIYFLFRELPYSVYEFFYPRSFKFKTPSWLNNAVFYQIYPQSFKDSNGDGIGDIQGIIDKLDYLVDLGVDCIWLNPVFDSPFMDAGYDISDFFKVAPRYGSNDDLKNLFEKARAKNIRIVLDLVAGHSSDECSWFQDSANNKTKPDNDKYIWTTKRFFREPFFFVKSKHARQGYYRKNFYDCQPALNYGYGMRLPFNSFEQDINDAAPKHTRETLKEVIAYWMELGASGFRVDMAESLVKRDFAYIKTIELWNDIRNWMQTRWPESILISEWSFPEASIKAGFQIDFILPFIFRGFPGLIFNETGTYAIGNCYFDKEGKGSAEIFIKHYLQQYRRTKNKGFICLPTANHDYQRPHCGNRNTLDELKALMLFNLTWADLPMIYYGDEIGMRYIENLKDIEGSALNPFINRAGTRTPMQWEKSVTAGFSSTDPEHLYLPIDDFNKPDFPNLAEQQQDENSLYHFVKFLIALRKSSKAFTKEGDLKVLCGQQANQYPLVYSRYIGKEKWLIAINPSAQKQQKQLDLQWKKQNLEALIQKGITINDSALLSCEAVSFALLKLK